MSGKVQVEEHPPKPPELELLEKIIECKRILQEICEGK